MCRQFFSIQAPSTEHSHQDQGRQTMKIKASALTKALNKKNQGPPSSNKGNNQTSGNQQSNQKQVSVVKSSGHGGVNDMKFQKNSQKSKKESRSESYREKTHELLERNFTKMKSLQKPLAPLIIAPATFVLPEKPQYTVFNEIDSFIEKDQPVPLPPPQVSQVELIATNNHFNVLADLADDDEKKPSFFIHPPTFQLPSAQINSLEDDDDL